MKFFSLLLMLVSLSAFSQELPEPRVNSLAEQRSSVEALLSKRSYSLEEHRTIKDYFKELESLVDDLENFSRYRRRFFRFTRDFGVEEFCRSTYLEEALWLRLQENCTQNGFFLCSESVRAYPALKGRIEAIADTDLRPEFGTSEFCR